MWLSTSGRHISFLTVFRFISQKKKGKNVYSTHRYLVGVLLSDLSDVFYSLFCGAGKKESRLGLMERHRVDEQRQPKQTQAGQKRGDKRRDVLMGAGDGIQISNEEIKEQARKGAHLCRPGLS